MDESTTTQIQQEKLQNGTKNDNSVPKIDI